MFKKFKDSGFTVIELLVSMVVIGILATIVYLSYEGYERRAQTSQIASAVATYQDAIGTGVILETDTTPSQAYSEDTDFLASCISSNTERCCFYHRFWQQSICGNNAELMANGFIDTNYAYDEVSKHLSGDGRPDIPNLTYGYPTCSSYQAVAGTTPPCSSGEIAYTSGLYDGALEKGYIQYYLPSSFENCGAQSKDILSITGGGWTLQYQNQIYTQRITSGSTQFTHCIVGIR